jgi:hypothetical protein
MAAARTTLYRSTPVPQTRAMVIAIATQTAQTLSAAVVAVLSVLAIFTSRTTARANPPEQLLLKEQMAPPARGNIPLPLLTVVNNHTLSSYTSQQLCNTVTNYA